MIPEPFLTSTVFSAVCAVIMLTNVTFGDKGRTILAVLVAQRARVMVVVDIYMNVECIFSGYVFFMTTQWLLFDTFIHKVKMDSSVTC